MLWSAFFALPTPTSIPSFSLFFLFLILLGFLADTTPSFSCRLLWPLAVNFSITSVIGFPAMYSSPKIRRVEQTAGAFQFTEMTCSSYINAEGETLASCAFSGYRIWGPTFLVSNCDRSNVTAADLLAGVCCQCNKICAADTACHFSECPYSFTSVCYDRRPGKQRLCVCPKRSSAASLTLSFDVLQTHSLGITQVNGITHWRNSECSER